MAKYEGFKSVELKRPDRSMFDHSAERRVSSRMGRLTPVLITETMPNDTFSHSTEVIVKLAPMIAPIFHRVNLYVHFFFVACRLLSKEWEPFITGGRLGEAISSPPLPPYMRIDDIQGVGLNALDLGSLFDYMGGPLIPDADATWVGDRRLDAMPWAAVYRCWYDYYRDRNYVADNELLPLPAGQVIIGADIQELVRTRTRCYEHDYLTSALPFTQRGAEVLMPLEGGTGANIYSRVTGLPITGDNFYVGTDPVLGVGVADFFSPISNFEAAEFRVETSSVSINDVRRAFALQTWMERNALAGSRYNESIMAHFGRKTSDGRLQRAEYLGGGKAVIQVTEINTTAYSEDASSAVIPPGNPAGRGSVYSTTNRFHYNCEEHGFVIGILSVMPSTAYMQGMPRMFVNRQTFLDYPWPGLAHLGEQEVFDYEVYASIATLPSYGTAHGVFGYQSRYADWKYSANSSHGDFRTTLDFWHLTRKFSALPVLGEAFVTFEDDLQDRVFNVAGGDTLWMYIYNQTKVKRALPYFGTPKIV